MATSQQVFFFFYIFRQLEAVIRLSESLAKMQLQPFATETPVDEAFRLFQVSTLDAAMSGSLAGLLTSMFVLRFLYLPDFLFQVRKDLPQRKTRR